MPVYFIRGGETEMVKIGWTARNVQGRLDGLQGGCWETLHLIREISSGRLSTERWLHRYFADQRVAREWFRFCPEMLTVEPPELPLPYRRVGLVIRDMRLQRGLSQKKFAEAVGASVATLADVENNGARKPPEWLLHAAARYFRIPADVLTYQAGGLW